MTILDKARRLGRPALLVSGVLACHAVVLFAIHVDAPSKAPERVLAMQLLTQPPEPPQIPIPAQLQPPMVRTAINPQAKVPQDPAAEGSAAKLVTRDTAEAAPSPPIATLPTPTPAPTPAPAEGRLLLKTVKDEVGFGVTTKVGKNLLNRISSEGVYASDEQFELVSRPPHWFLKPIASAKNSTAINDKIIFKEQKLFAGDRICLIGKSGRRAMDLTVVFQ